ncbi:unnamed protein product [Allacma fusca]|uniref:BTB domain-containing protein n=1 Tax=Allacma fusca TaxID=39272 RepID=A0A8J2L773_9HEXA|nr:unnamed protein product [Allacma fusca]
MSNASSLRPSTSNQTRSPVGVISQNEFVHCDSVGEAYITFLRRQKNCDVTFVVGEEKRIIKCHKFFLMCRSPVFETMFSKNWDNCGPIRLPDVEPGTFKLFLEFVYGDKFTNSIPMAIKLLHLGDKYDLKPLVKKCERLMKENVQLKDAVETFTIARLYSLQNLMDQAGDLLAWNFKELSKQGNFRAINEETLIYLLQRDDLPLGELELFKIVLSWARYNMVENSSYSEILKNMIPLIRFPLMTAQEFATNVYPTQVLPQNDVIDLFLYFNSEGAERNDVSKRIHFSAIPRKMPIKLWLYKSVTNKAGAVYVNNVSSYGTLEQYESQEDYMDIFFDERRPLIHSEDIKLVSLLLEGLNIDSCLPNGSSIKKEAGFMVCVTIQILDSSGTGKIIFTRTCATTKGVETNFGIVPHIQLLAGVKYRVLVKYEEKVRFKPNVPSLTFNSTLSDSNFCQTLRVQLASNKFSSQLDPYGRIDVVSKFNSFDLLLNADSTYIP